MPFFPSSALFQKNNAEQVSVDSDIMYMAVLIFLKCLDLRKNTYSRTTSWEFLLHQAFCCHFPVWTARLSLVAAGPTEQYSQRK
jgi:hypothetical protein